MTRQPRRTTPSVVAWRASVGRRLHAELLALGRTVPGLYEGIVTRTTESLWNEAVDIEIRKPGTGARALLRMISLSEAVPDAVGNE